MEQVLVHSGEGGGTAALNACLQSETSWEEQQSVEYEVFLSFRGPDVRKSFADFLYSYLVRSKIRTFRDEEELLKGETIGAALVQAITESKIYIPILTESYAGSKWCLQELAKMVECCRKGKGHIILPIFYFVDPRDVRHQAGPYEDAFEQHSEKHDPLIVQAWREALQEVGQMKGWHVTDSDGQGAVIDEVFSKVELHLRNNYTLVTEELVGIDCHVEEATRLLNLESGDVKVVGIHGIGGMGKTTIAKAVYDNICTSFNRCCFLENVREMLSKNDGITALQRKFISSIMRDDVEVKDASEGVSIIRQRVCKYKVLVVLDDVDDSFEFGQILGKIGHFSSESRFIITTRNKRVVEFLDEYRLYEPKEMSHEHSLQLFSMHAFHMHHPPEGYATLCDEFIEVAAKLPLALKVIGSLLFRGDRRFGEEKLAELKKVPAATSNKVQQRLKISYNELSPNEKHMFLDIACFFIGEDKELPFHMWSDSNLYPESGIRTLVHRSLVKIDERNKFWMHDLLRDLGRAIVIEEDVERPWRRSRIWSYEDAVNMFKNGEGTHQVKMLQICLPYDENFDLTDKEFEKLSALKYLNLNGGSLTGDFSGILPDISWIKLHYCNPIPTDLNLSKVVIFDLQGCYVEDDWTGWNRLQVASNLKVAVLNYCDLLHRVPDLSRCRSLEWIDLSSCFWMKGVLDIGSFRNLKVVRVPGTAISELRGDIGKLQKLQEIVTGKLVWRAEQVLTLSTALKRLTISFPEVRNLLDLKDLEVLCFLDCETAPEIPACIWKLSKLTVFQLFNCNFNGSLLSDLEADQEGALPSSLTCLTVYQCWGLNRLPNLANLNRLVVLRVVHFEFSEIHGLGELRALETLEVSASSTLHNLRGLENLVLLKELTVTSCCRLECLPSLSNLIKLHKLVIDDCPILTKVQGLGELRRSLLHLEVIRCDGVSNIQGIESLEALETLKLQSINQLVPFPDLSHLQNLKELRITSFRQLTAVTGLESLLSLQTLEMTGCESLRKLPDLSGLENLETLDVSGCVRLVHVTGLCRLESLEQVSLSGCTSIEEVPDISGLKNLDELDLSGCRELVKVTGLEKLGMLRKLNMFDCKSIKELPDMSGLKKLHDLNLKGCSQLKKVDGLEGLEDLWDVDMGRRLKTKHCLKSAAFRARHLPRSFRGALRNRRDGNNVMKTWVKDVYYTNKLPYI
ncbi:Disease resistance protein L6 [Linum perenne]